MYAHCVETIIDMLIFNFDSRVYYVWQKKSIENAFPESVYIVHFVTKI